MQKEAKAQKAWQEERNKMGCCGLWPFQFGGWAQTCCDAHDYEYELMHQGVQTKTLNEVDNAFLKCMLIRAATGPFPRLQTAQSYTMYGIAHAWGLLFWKGRR